MMPRKQPRNIGANAPPARPEPADATTKPIIAPMQHT
jgi:hypothetical protein